MDLGGEWAAAPSDEELRRQLGQADFDPDGWARIPVPGHWRSHPDFAAHDGPILYCRRFAAATPTPGQRCFLTFEGIFYEADVWLDGAYLGDTQGYFFPHTFEIGDQLAAGDEHLLAVEVSCPPPSDLTAKRPLTGIFQHWDCIDPAWNPGGIWAPVRVQTTGPVRIQSCKVLCREANEDTATLEFEAHLDPVEPTTVTVRTTARLEGDPNPAAEHLTEETLAAGVNRVRWRLGVDRPRLWWPHSLGAQPLYEVEVTVHIGGSGPDEDGDDGPTVTGPPSDRCRLLTGLRQVSLRNFIATINGERLYLKGANLGPTRRALAETTPAELAADVTLARQAGLDLLRVHAHVTRPELYEAADRQGMLLWQDLPLQWGYGQVRRQAVSQARQAVTGLGHHPSIAVWCGHNEPIAIDVAAGTLAPRTLGRLVSGQALPSWNKTVLDRSIRRSLERADGSRPVVAHSGILPHPAWGTDTHLYYGWYHGHERDFPAALARFPVLARFVSEFGAQAVPDSAEWMEPDRWPDLDWDRLADHHCLQREIFELRVPPRRFRSLAEWRAATQAYQATLLRFHIETLRRLKYRPGGGFCLFLLADAQPAVSWSILDHERRPKAAYHAVAAACAPVIVTASRPAVSYRAGERIGLDVHVVSDRRQPLQGAIATAALRWPGGEHTWRFAGDVPGDSCVRVGRVEQAVDRPGPVTLDLALRWDGGEVTNCYTSEVVA
jgi:beta-mannosidase